MAITFNVAGLALTNSINANQNFGALSYGNITYTDINTFIAFSTSINSYVQNILQNSSNGASAAAKYAVVNNLGTATANRGDFGINSSGFVGAGSLSLPNAVHVTAASGELVIGTTTNNGIRFVVNNGATDALSILPTGQVNFGGGGAGSIFYQTGVGTSSFLPIGANGYVLQSTGAAPFWAASGAFTPNSVAITGGSITGTSISGAAGSFTTLTATSAALGAVTITATGTPLTVNSADSTSEKISFQDAGGLRGSIGATAALSFAVYNASNTQMLGVDGSGNATFSGAITANGLVSITTSGQTSTLALTDSGGNGANLRLVGNGGIAPNKSIRACNGSLQIVNSAYSAAIFSMDDSGNAAFAGQIVTNYAGTGLVLNGSPSFYNKMQFQENGTTCGYIQSTAATAFAVVNAGNSNNILSLSQAGDATFSGAITAKGLVSITTSGQNLTLELTDSGVSGANLRLVGNGGTAPNKSIRAYNGSLQIINSAYNAAIFSLDDSGNASATTFTGTSDETLKENWQNPDYKNITNFAAGVVNYGGFTWKGKDARSLGIPAQYYENDRTYNLAVYTDSEGVKSFNYGGAAMVTATANSKYIQELEQRITALEARL